MFYMKRNKNRIDSWKNMQRYPIPKENFWSKLNFYNRSGWVILGRGQPHRVRTPHVQTPRSYYQICGFNDLIIWYICGIDGIPLRNYLFFIVLNRVLRGFSTLYLFFCISRESHMFGCLSVCWSFCAIRSRKLPI